ncbi:MAG: tRNA pseudouridine(38-40) synthase TruA [Hydrogenimonas sp.]|nr:MAG: tRNA pseudouridine(38-40) synthase TruA [Hydrogenimonas sp.]
MRVKAVIAYDGAAFYGFQSQTTTPKTVTGALSRAGAKLGINSPIIGSGRTDRGVHATGQVIHFDLPTHWQNNLEKLKTVYNRLLSPHIQIKTITPVDDSFHARFNAKRRIYRYVFKATPLTPFESLYACHLHHCDPEKLRIALKRFEGTHDFYGFHKKGSDPGSTVRTIFRTDVKTFRRYIMLYIEANGFLRSQVRMIVGATTAFMHGSLTLEQIDEQLAKKAIHTTVLAPPQGLYLARVIY